MDSFEFQRYVTIGQHIPTGSPIHHLDPRTRVVAALILLLSITVAPGLLGLGVALAAIVTLTAIARVPIGYALKGILAPLPFILFLVALQILLGPSPLPGTGQESLPTVILWRWGPFTVSPFSIASGLRILLRFPGLILIITLFSAVTSTAETVHGLASLLRPLQHLRLPVQDLVLMIQVSLRFLPLLAREAERIAKSQASRGAEWGTGRSGLLRRARQALPILIPLFLVSLQRAESLAIAMEARGYRSHGERTSLVQLRFHLKDAVALLGCGALAAAIMLL
jgi:energy-coupling factor transport system permease protein